MEFSLSMIFSSGRDSTRVEELQRKREQEPAAQLAQDGKAAGDLNTRTSSGECFGLFDCEEVAFAVRTTAKPAS